MRIEITEAMWLDERETFSFDELAELSGLAPAELRQLMELDVLAPADLGSAQPAFTADCLAAARAACRLREAFDLDAAGLAVALALLERIAALDAELRSIEAQLPGRRRRGGTPGQHQPPMV